MKGKPAARYTIAELVTAIHAGTLPTRDRARLERALGPRALSRPGRRPDLDAWSRMDALHILHREFGLSVRDADAVDALEKRRVGHEDEIEKLRHLYDTEYKLGRGARPFGGPIEIRKK